MINKTILRRFLYVGTSLVILVALILSFFVIPQVRMDTSPYATPEIAILALWILVVIQMLIVAALIYTIKFSYRKGHFKNGFLLIAGVVLILLSLMLIDGAFAYLGNPDLQSTATSMFICVGFNFLAGVLSLISQFFKGH